jgi:hypothetical protein
MGLYSSGQKQLEGGNFHSALDCLNSAISLQPSSATFLRERAAVYLFLPLVFLFVSLGSITFILLLLLFLFYF